MGEAEVLRRRFLRECAVLDTAREPLFDRIIFTAAQIMRVPMASIVLIDDERAWAKALVGKIDVQRSRDQSLTDVVVREGGPLFVEDALEDQRLAPRTALPTGQRVRGFFSAPLIAPGGVRVGAISTMTDMPRGYTTRQTDALVQLAAQAMELFCLRSPGIDVSDTAD